MEGGRRERKLRGRGGRVPATPLFLGSRMLKFIICTSPSTNTAFPVEGERKETSSTSTEEALKLLELSLQQPLSCFSSAAFPQLPLLSCLSSAAFPQLPFLSCPSTAAAALLSFLSCYSFSCISAASPQLMRLCCLFPAGSPQLHRFSYQASFILYTVYSVYAVLYIYTLPILVSLGTRSRWRQ